MTIVSVIMTNTAMNTLILLGGTVYGIYLKLKMFKSNKKMMPVLKGTHIGNTSSDRSPSKINTSSRMNEFSIFSDLNKERLKKGGMQFTRQNIYQKASSRTRKIIIIRYEDDYKLFQNI